MWQCQKLHTSIHAIMFSRHHTSIYWPHIMIISAPKSRTAQVCGYKFIYIQVQHTIAYMVHVEEKRCTGRLQNMNMTWISAHMKYSIHMHVHEEKDRETHGLNLEMNRTVWKNFLSLLAAALDLKEFFCYWSGRLEQNMPRALDT